MLSDSVIPSSWQSLAWLSDVNSEAGRSYAVGGAVRDWLRGAKSADLDVVVEGLEREVLVEILSRHGSVHDVGASFAVLKWRPTGGGAAVDVAQPRVERSTGPAHRDFEVQSDPGIGIEKDLARRDFTINAVAVDLLSGVRVDPFGGCADLEQGVLRAVGDARERFLEDPLRILRGAGFVARFGLRVAADTRRGMQEVAPELASVSHERVGAELVKLLERSPRPSLGLRLLEETGALAFVLPELLPSVGFEQNNAHHHLDVWEHVLLSVDEAAERGSGIAVRLAALFHDLGKPETYTEERDADGALRGRFLGHEGVSAERAAEILARLRVGAVEGVAADVPERVVALVRHHLVSIDAEASDRAVRRFVHRVGGIARTREVLELWAADRSAHAEGLDPAAYVALRTRVEAAADVPVSAHVLALDGGEIQRRFALEGRAVGDLKQQLLEAVVAGDVPNEQEALLAHARALLVAD